MTGLKIAVIIFGLFFPSYPIINEDDIDNTIQYISSNKTNINKIEQINNIDKEDNNKIKNIIPKKSEPIKTYNYKINDYKNDLFKYQGGIVKKEFNGDITTIDYNMKRDIEDRDIIDVDRVYDKYVTKIDSNNRTDKTITLNNITNHYYEIKNNKINNNEIKIVILYFHGMGGNYKQGANDYTFGGNFNRIQNLMIQNKGVYISAGFSDFYDRGSSEIVYLIQNLHKTYPNAKIMLSGGSSGGTLLWNIMKYPEMQNLIKGIILIGSVMEINSDVLKHNIPIYIGHGTKDPNIGYKAKYNYYKQVKEYNNNYPIKVEFFQGGVHGTPIRMIDWQKTINWILKYNEI